MSTQWMNKLKTFIKSSGGQKYILAVAGDPTLREHLRQIFGNILGIASITSHPSIWAQIDISIPEIIIAELDLLSKEDLGQKLKEDLRTMHVPILALAPEGKPVSEKELSRLGAVGVVQEPYDLEELKLRILNFLEPGEGEVSGDEFGLDTLDEKLEKLNQIQEDEIEEDVTQEELVSLETLDEKLKRLDQGEEDKTLEEELSLDTLDEKLDKLNQLEGDETLSLEEKTAGYSESQELPSQDIDGLLSEIEVVQEDTGYEPKGPEPKGYEPEAQEPPTKEKDMQIGRGDEELERIDSAEDRGVYLDVAGEAEEHPEPEPQYTEEEGASGVEEEDFPKMLESWVRNITEKQVAKVIARQELTKVIEKVAERVVPEIAEGMVATEIEHLKKRIRQF